MEIPNEDAAEIREITRLLVEAFDALQTRRRELYQEAAAVLRRAEDQAQQIVARGEEQGAELEAAAGARAEQVLREAEQRGLRAADEQAQRRREVLRQPMEDLRAAVGHLKEGGFLEDTLAGDLAATIERLRPIADSANGAAQNPL